MLYGPRGLQFDWGVVGQAMTTRLHTTKLEGNGIQSYFRTINKQQIDAKPEHPYNTLPQQLNDTNTTDDMDDTEEGTYFVDESGNYYYQATKDSEPVLTEPPDGDNIQFIVEEEDDENSIGAADNLDNEIEHESSSTAAAGGTTATKMRKQITTKVEVDDFGTVDGVAFDGNDADGDGESRMWCIFFVFFFKQTQISIEIPHCLEMFGIFSELCLYNGWERRSHWWWWNTRWTGWQCGRRESVRNLIICQIELHIAHTHAEIITKKFFISNSPCKKNINRYEFDEDEEEAEEDDNTDDDTTTVKKQKRKTAAASAKATKKSQVSLAMHMCSYCNYTSPKRYLLSRHMKSHSEERPYKCSVCERGFKTLASLQNHVNTHTGTKVLC